MTPRFIIDLQSIVIRYLVDGIWQHDPLYPTECDVNGNINNVIVITEAETGAETAVETAVESHHGAGAEAESETSGEKTADCGVISAAVAGDDVVSRQERSDNESQTPQYKGDCPAATQEKAPVRTDIASLGGKSQGKSRNSEQ